MLDDRLIDVSFYDMETWDPACFYADGIRNAIVNSFQVLDARDRIRSLRAAGINVIAIYGFCYFGPSLHYQERDVIAAIALAKEFGIGMVWVDAEADAHDITGLAHLRRSNPAERIEQLQAAVDRVEAAGLRVGIYTAGWYWPDKMSNATKFSRYPLWHALYNSPPSPVPNVRFGGWTTAEIHQYTSTKSLCGRGRDHNFLFVGEGQEEEMPDPRIEELIIRMAATDVGDAPDDGSHPLDYYLKVYRERDASDQETQAWLGNLNSAIHSVATAVAAGNGDPASIIAAFRKVADQLEGKTDQ